MDGKTFERLFIEILTEFIERKGLKNAPLAKKAWPDAKDPVGKWRKMRNMGQGMYMGDAFDMAQALGIGFTELCGIVQGRVVEASLGRRAVVEPEKK